MTEERTPDLDHDPEVTPPTDVPEESNTVAETQPADDVGTSDVDSSPLVESEVPASEVTNDDRLIALLSYVSQAILPFILPIIVLLSESNKKRPFQRYHAIQSLGLALAITIIALVVTLGTFVIQVIPIIGQIVGLVIFCLSPLAAMAALGLVVYYGYKAYQGEYFKIPALTTFMEDQGWL